MGPIVLVEECELKTADCNSPFRNPHSALRNRLRINLGSGGTIFPGWFHLDRKDFRALYGEAGEIFLQHDLTNGLPFGDNSVETVFCEHLLEHLDIQETLALAREVHRVLGPGGVWRIAVPDALYRPEMEPPGAFGHKIMWCQELLAAVLHEAGFKVDVIQAWTREREIYRSTMPVGPKHGEVNRKDSLIVDGIKP